VPDRIVTVFGGTGFLGRHVVRRLRAHGLAVRVANRHPRHAEAAFAGEIGIEAGYVDVHDRASVGEALAGVWGAVNAVSLYVERGAETFDAVHVKAARTVAELARQAGVERLVLVSGIGASTASPSLYVRKRGEGEQAVQAAFPGAAIVRPAVMFGIGGGIASVVLDLLQRLPVYPLFGRGQTRLQPVSVEDVAEAIVRIMLRPALEPARYEFGGPRIFTYEEFVRMVARESGRRALLVPFPFGGWHLLARLAEFLPNPPVTRNQVELMEVDTVASQRMPGLRELGIEPQPVEDAVRSITRNER
jgi:NADH dehydrogenase